MLSAPNKYNSEYQEGEHDPSESEGYLYSRLHGGASQQLDKGSEYSYRH